jgi:hypothetical protein
MDRVYRVTRYLGWAWLIIIGGLMITPGGIMTCTVCTPPIVMLLGIVSLLLGGVGFVGELRAPKRMDPQH